MSSNWNRPGDSWQDPPNANWTQPPESVPPPHVEDDYPPHAQQEPYAYASESDNFLDASFLPEQDVFPDNQETYEEEESKNAEGSDPITTSGSWQKQLWQYVTLIVFPLLFFGIASLLVLPPIAAGHAYLPQVASWFIVIVFLAVAVGQGVAVYFSAPHHNMWILGTLGGFLLLLLLGVFALAGPVLATLLLLAILGGCTYLARRCIHSVPEGFVDIVYVAGKYERTLYTGINLLWPWEQTAHQVKIEEISWSCNPQTVQLSPEEYVTLGADIYYQVIPEDAHLAVTQISNWEESLHHLLETTLQTISTNFEPTDLLPWPQGRQAYKAQTTHPDPQTPDLPDQDDFTGGPARREQIDRLLFEQMRDGVAQWGVQINKVLIRDVKLVPHTMAGISPSPMMSDYTNTANDEEEKEPVSVSSGIKQSNTQSTNTSNSSNGGESGSRIHEEPTEVLQPGTLPTPDLPLSSQKIYSEETLKKAYGEVQNGKVTDPLTIRQIARSFEAIARDPEACQKVSFDPDRAAANLYLQAEHYERTH
jgi:regulator of protease activity HflC (stomatin/prohibitin superfamily)